jgi:hypothetical protein
MMNFNPMDEYKDKAEKTKAWKNAVKNNIYAIDFMGNKYPVKDYSVEQLAFVAGLWRIQDKLPHEITHVRDRDFVLIKKLDYKENTLFDFYNAKHVSYNCYGPFILNVSETDYIVTKYETDKGAYLRLDKTLEDALKFCDEYNQLLNAVACKNKTKTK